MSRYSLVWIETIISMKKSGGDEDRESGDGGTSSSGSKRRRSDNNNNNDNNDDDDEPKEVGKDDANDTTNQQQKGKESLIHLGTKITVRTKTHDGGSSSQVQSGAEEDNTTTDETTNNRMDAFAMYSDGTTRRTRVSTEQHISKFLNGNNYQDDQQDRYEGESRSSFDFYKESVRIQF